MPLFSKLFNMNTKKMADWCFGTTYSFYNCNLRKLKIAHTFPNDDKFVKVGFRLTVGDVINSPIVQLYPHDLGKAISDLFLIKKAKEKELQK